MLPIKSFWLDGNWDAPPPPAADAAYSGRIGRGLLRGVFRSLLIVGLLTVG